MCFFERLRVSPVSEKKDWKNDSGISPTSSGNLWLPGQTLPSLKTLKAGARNSCCSAPVGRLLAA